MTTTTRTHRLSLIEWNRRIDNAQTTIATYEAIRAALVALAPTMPTALATAIVTDQIADTDRLIVEFEEDLDTQMSEALEDGYDPDDFI